MIKADIALEVRKTGPKSLDEAIKQAKQIEVAFNTISKLEINNIAPSSSAANETLMNLATAQMQEIQNLTKEVANLKLSHKKEKYETDMYCAICDLKNHSTANCFYNGKNKNRNISKNNNTENTSNNSQGKNAWNQPSPMYPQYMQPYMPQQHATPQNFWPYQTPPQYPYYNGMQNWPNNSYYDGNYYDRRGNFQNDRRKQPHKNDNYKNDEQKDQKPDKDSKN